MAWHNEFARNEGGDRVVYVRQSPVYGWQAWRAFGGLAGGRWDETGFRPRVGGAVEISYEDTWCEPEASFYA